LSGVARRKILRYLGSERWELSMRTMGLSRHRLLRIEWPISICAGYGMVQPDARRKVRYAWKKASLEDREACLPKLALRRG
jgi:hypothetical protein